MNRQIIFTPEKEASRDLTYSEHSSCQQSIHILFQDNGVENYEFLLKAYRTAISTYLSCHKIESPITFLRGLISRFDELARESGLQPDDYGNVGAHILISTGKMLWLLSSDTSGIFLGGERIYTPFQNIEPSAISEVPIRDGEAQTELFPNSIKDYLRLYAIPIPKKNELEVVLGCGERQKNPVLELLHAQPPGACTPGEPLKQYIPLKYLDHKVIMITFKGGYDPSRPLIANDIPVALAGASDRSIPALALYVVLIAVIAIAAIWGVAQLTGDQEIGTPMQAGMEDLTAPGGAAVDLSGGNQAVDEAPRLTTLELSEGWKRSFSKPVTSSPALAGNRVLFGCRDGHLYALNSETGSIEWDYDSQAGIGASPIVNGTNTVCANYNGEVFSLTLSDGTRNWKRKLPGKISSSPLINGGNVVVGCYDGTLYSLALDSGTVLWKYSTGAPIRSTPILAGGLVLAASYNGNLYALDPSSGKERWRYAIGGKIDSSPAADNEQTYLGGPDGTLHAIALADGSVRWKAALGGPVKSAIELCGTHLFAGSNDSFIYCLDKTNGAILWKQGTGDIILSRPRCSDRYLFSASYDGKLYLLEQESGVVIDSFDTGAKIFSTPLIEGDRIFFGNNAGAFYCLHYLQRPAS